jgi:3-hydroxybutyryl-CoA dehydrogenase
MADFQGLKVGVIGAGTMGGGIAQVAATFGHKTMVVDQFIPALEKSQASIRGNIDKQVEKGKLTVDKANIVKENLAFSSSYDTLIDCDLIIEAIVEDLDVKQKLFTGLDQRVKDICLLASNTSSLSIASIAQACKKPERFIGIHFFNPAMLMPLVEIIPAITTSDETTQQAKNIIDAWGKVTVIAKDTPGFIVNRVARPYYGEAIRIYEEGIADFATIDWAMRETGGFRMGPFELMDLIGNDVNYTVTETVWKQFFYDPRYRPSLTQKRLFEAKQFGKKSGKGYYDYSKPLPQPVEDKQLAETICNRIVLMLINEAADAIYFRTASREDIDLAMTKGVNYPKGLLQWADEWGVEKCLSEMERLYAYYCEDRYRPSVQFRKMIKEGKKKFYD